VIARLPRTARAALFAALLAVAALTVSVASAAPAAKPRVTFVGDSVSESIDYTASARRILQSRFAIRFDLATCRRLVEPSCAFKGSAPRTALEAVEAYGGALGDVLVVSVGYNEGSAGYGRGIDQVVRAARRAGVDGVVWLTLREAGEHADVYRATNGAIREAAMRWPELVVADWNAFSAGRTWFRRDGLHLNPAGAEALARFLRPRVLRAAGS
jgi:hypothetical protein